MPVRHQLPFSRRWPLPMGDPSMCVLCGLVQTGSNRRLPRCGRGALPLSYGPMTAARVMPCRGGGARSITRPSEPGDRRENVGTRGRTRTSDEPGVGSRRSTAELRACGRRDRDRTDGLLCFKQALYAFLSYSPKVDLAGLEPTASALQVRCSPVLSYRARVPLPSLASGYSSTLGQASTHPNVQCGPSF